MSNHKKHKKRMSKNGYILIVLLIAIAGFFLGFLVAPKETQQVSQGTNPKAAPFSENLLTNPLLEAIYANISGTVVKKGKDYFILETDGQQFTIYNAESIALTSFRLEKNNVSQTLKFKDIQIGDMLNGGISIIPNKESLIGYLPERKPGDIIAHRFEVTRK